MKLYLFLCLFAAEILANDDYELLVLGDRSQPVSFYLLPMSYQGEGVNPSYEVEEAIKVALSSAGLFTMPLRTQVPSDTENLSAWQMQNIRFVLTGHLFEHNNSLSLRLHVQDTFLNDGFAITGILIPDQLRTSAGMFADQIYRSFFYAAYTTRKTLQELENENAALTNYLHHIVKTYKSHWQSGDARGECLVDIQQLPGGDVFTHKMQKNCFANEAFAAEIQSLLDQVQQLPYEHHKAQFNKYLHITFSR